MKLMTNLVSASAEILIIRKVKFCAFCCGSRSGGDFLVECIGNGGGRAKEQRMNRRETVKVYEKYDKLGVGIGGNLGYEKSEILDNFCGSRFGDGLLVEFIV